MFKSIHDKKNHIACCYCREYFDNGIQGQMMAYLNERGWRNRFG